MATLVKNVQLFVDGKHVPMNEKITINVTPTGSDKTPRVITIETMAGGVCTLDMQEAP